MKTKYILLFALLFAFLSGGSFSAFGQEQKTVKNFTLTSHKGEVVKLDQYAGSKAAVVVVFTGNHCVYSKKYEDRLVQMANTYQPKGIQFLLINPNNPKVNPEETKEMNAIRAKEKNFIFPYLQDVDQTVARDFGAEKQPEAYALVNEGGVWKVLYSGRIDDNPLMAEKVKTNYLSAALDKILAGDKSPSENTPPSGCNIRF